MRSDAGAAVAQAIAKRMLTAAITTRAIAKTMLLRTCKSLNSARDLVAYLIADPPRGGYSSSFNKVARYLIRRELLSRLSVMNETTR